MRAERGGVGGRVGDKMCIQYVKGEVVKTDVGAIRPSYPKRNSRRF